MARRTSLAPSVAEKTEDRSRRRTADARLEPLTEPLSPLTPTPSSKMGSSPATPLIIYSDDDTDDIAHPRSRSEQKASKKTPARKLEVQSTGTSGRLDNVTTLGPTVSGGRTHRSAGSESDASPSSRPPISLSYCGRPYVRLGYMRSHQERCDKCKAAQEIAEGSTASETGEALPSSAFGIPGGKDDRKEDDLKKTEMDQHRKEELLENNDTSTQMISLNLRKVATSRLVKGEMEGYLYIHRDTKGGLVKIGYSNDPQRRGQQHRKCERNLVYIHISNRTKLMKRAERLVKLDLGHVCRPWYCAKCQHTHKEYFEVDEDKAKMIVDRWVDWINNCDPYDQTGDMLPIWSRLLHYDRVAAPGIGSHDHEARWAHWESVLSAPSADDIARFDKLRITPSEHVRGGEQAVTGMRADSDEKDRGSQSLSRQNGGRLVDAGILASLGPVRHIVVDRKGRNRFSMTFEVECQVRQVQERASVDCSSQQRS